MKSQEKYLQDLKQWLSDTSDSPLEEMTDFFTKRLDGYEEHMSIWETSYQMFSEILPFDRGCDYAEGSPVQLPAYAGGTLH